MRKTKQGYCYIENGKPVVNLKMKPKQIDYVNTIRDHYLCEKYQQALSAWNDSCMEVENAMFDGENTICVYFDDKADFISIFQPVTFLSTGEKTTKITEINNSLCTQK